MIGFEYKISGAPIEDVNGRYRLYGNYGWNNLPQYINENGKYVMGPSPVDSDMFGIAPIYDGDVWWPDTVYSIYFDEGYFSNVTEMDYSSFSGKFGSAPDLKIIKL